MVESRDALTRKRHDIMLNHIEQRVSLIAGRDANCVGLHRKTMNELLIGNQSANEKLLTGVTTFLDGGTFNLTSLMGPVPTRLLRQTEMKNKLAMLKPHSISLKDYVNILAESSAIGGEFRLSDKTLLIMSKLDYQIDLRFDVVKGTIINFALDLDYVQMIIKISVPTTLDISARSKVKRDSMPNASSAKVNVDLELVKRIKEKLIHSRTILDNKTLKLHDQSEPVWSPESMAVGLAIWQILLETDVFGPLFEDHCSFDYDMKSIIFVDGKTGVHKMTQPPPNIGGKESFVLLNIGQQDMITEPSKVFIGSTTVEKVRTALKTMVAAFRKSSGISSDEAKDASSHISGSSQIVSCNRKLLEMAVLLLLMHSNQNITAVFESYNGKTRGLSTKSLTLELQEDTAEGDLNKLSKQAAKHLFEKFEQKSFAGSLKIFFDVQNAKLGIGIDARPESIDNICMFPALQSSGIILLGTNALNSVARNLERQTVCIDEHNVNGISVLATERHSFTQYSQLGLPSVLNSFTSKKINDGFDLKENGTLSKITGMQSYLAAFRNVDRLMLSQMMQLGHNHNNSFGSHMGNLQNFMHGTTLRLSSAIEECDSIEYQIKTSTQLLRDHGPMMRIEITHNFLNGLTLDSLQNACLETILVAKENVIVLNKKIIADYFLFNSLAIVGLHRSALKSASSDTVSISRIAHLSYANTTGNLLQNLYSGRAFQSENSPFPQLASKALQRVFIEEPTNKMLVTLGFKERVDESSDVVLGSKPIPICLENRAAYHSNSLLRVLFFPTCLHDSCNQSFLDTKQLFAHLDDNKHHKTGELHKTTQKVVRGVITSFIENTKLDVPQRQIINEYLLGKHIITTSCAGAGKSLVLGCIIRIHEFLHPNSILILCGQQQSGKNLDENTKTIHSAFGMGTGTDLITNEDFIKAFKKTNKNYQHITTIIVDEMFNAERRIMEGMFACLQDQFNVPNIASKIQFIFFGDIKQLGNRPPPPFPSITPPLTFSPFPSPFPTLTPPSTPLPHPFSTLTPLYATLLNPDLTYQGRLI